MSEKYEIHASDCPALTWIPDDRRHRPCCPGSQMVAVKREELKELVEAVDQAVRFISGNPLRGPGPEGMKVRDSLIWSTQPFRRGEK